MVGGVLVPFAGEGSGVANLSWGQREIWYAIRGRRMSLPLGAAVPLPAGVSAEAVAAELGFILSRHPSLRTRLRFGAGGGVQQEVAASGKVVMEVVDCGGQDPAVAAEEIRYRFCETEFDYASEWPVRWAVVTHRGAPAYLVSMISHLAIDGTGITAMLKELAGWPGEIGLASGIATAGDDEEPGERPDAASGRTVPVEQARWQASPAGRRVSDAALRYWERVLRGVPARRFPPSADPRNPRWWLATGDSPAIHLAARAIAARLGITTAPVLLAAYAVAMARVMGSNPVLAQVIVSNRFRPSLANTVSTVAQAGLIAIDVAGVTFDVAVERAQLASVIASKYAYYDPDRLHERIAEINEQRGEEVDTGCFFNDARMRLSTEDIGPAPTPGQLRAVLGRTSLHWDEPLTGLPARLERAAGYENFFLNLTDGEDPAADSVGFLIVQDTHYMSMADTEACVRGIESILISAAFDAAALTGV
jgi:hypothetical protein